MPDELRNEMILASAGSGKTYQLTNRFIGLMALGVDPERIIALTFTRKAAGEFLESILEKLANAAVAKTAARKLASELSADHLSQQDFQLMLRVLIKRIHLLSLGTIDSFFVSILRNFPFEFGLSGGFSILNEHLAGVEQHRVYRRVFQRAAGKKAQREFLEAFKLATFGSEESSLLRDLNRFIDQNHEIYLDAPSALRWGNPDVIWPNGSVWLQATCDLESELRELIRGFQDEGLDQKQLARWLTFQEFALSHAPGNQFKRELRYLLPKLLEVFPGLQARSAKLTVERRKQELSPPQCARAERIVRHMVWSEIENRLSRTRGIWAVLNKYESSYGDLVRRRGKLTFYDLQLILSGHETSAGQSLGKLSQLPGDDARLQIDYRLDARFDHWLLDEFQDTNYLQWSVIENLVDEALQDVSGQRSLFQVGDIKQAIYAWRGGDVKLFHEIKEQYNRNGEEKIIERPLNDSYRSGPQIIEMVNATFGDTAVMADMFPKRAIDRWQWQAHHSKRPNFEGYGCLLNTIVPEEGIDFDGAKALRYKLVCGILEEVRHLFPSRSCAILVQQNKIGVEIVDYIRARTTIPVTNEAEVAIAGDNPLTLALMSLFKFVAHPGDSLAWQHLMMTPFERPINNLYSSRDGLVLGILGKVYRGGFESVASEWLQLLEKGGYLLDGFSSRRADEFLVAARLFDSTGNKSIPEFLAYARTFTSRDPETRGAVQVMTIHKSKGLTFDTVILPDLGGSSLANVRRGIGVQRNKQREVDWVLSLPPTDITKADPVLGEYRSELEAEACYEQLCKLYVGMTRASHAMYLITEPPKPKSKTNNYIKFLHETLSANEPTDSDFGGAPARVVYETGSRDWPEQVLDGEDHYEPPQKLAPIEIDGALKRSRLPRRTPSGSEQFVLTSDQLFSRKSGSAREHGILVHRLFEQIEWLEFDTPARLKAFTESDGIVGRRAAREVVACFENAGVKALLSQPAGEVELWRERRFEMVLDGSWITGTFDRVVLERNEDGQTPKNAEIIDFKTDDIQAGDLEKRLERYRPQLALYREVLSKMTGLEGEKIKCFLLFSKLKKVVEL